MSGYKRMISYMYNYEEGVKKNNIGYARIEARNGQCKFTLYLQTQGHIDGINKAYLIKRVENGMKLIPLGDVAIKNQQINAVFLTDEMNILKSGYGLSDICGVLIFLREECFFATQWDSKGVLLKEVMQGLRAKSFNHSEMLKASTIEEEVVIEELESDDRKNHSLTDENKDDKNQGEYEEVSSEQVEIEESIELKSIELQSEQAQPQELESAEKEPVGLEELESAEDEPKELVESELEEDESIESVEVESRVQLDLVEDKEVTPEILEPASQDEKASATDSSASLEAWNKVRKNPNLNRTREMEEESDIAQYMFDNYPKVKAFEDGNVVTCVKIEPKDIGNLPKDAWGLMNNSFVLHGYYGHNHLIFAKARVGREFRYILGVPGVFHNREKFMARMFGFENFKPTRRREIRQGEFGYWYVYL